MQGITMRFLASTAVSTAPPVVLQFRLDWSFVPGTVILVTTILPDHFLHVVVVPRLPVHPPWRMHPLGG
jgi:hypothetical protein